MNKFTDIKPNIYIIEKYIDFDKEVSIIGCKNSNNDIIYYDIVQNKHKNSILIETIFPDNNLSKTIKYKIINIFNKILELFNTRGIICVELFFIKDDLIYYNECCLRVHNSGHHTLKSSYTSQFENHLKCYGFTVRTTYKCIFRTFLHNIISGLQTEEIINQKCDLKKIHII